MLIIALVLAVIGLAALVFAVVTSNALVAWVCIGASLLGVVLLIVDALAERRRRTAGPAAEPEDGAEAADDGDGGAEATYENFDAEYPDGAASEPDEADEPADTDEVSDEENAH